MPACTCTCESRFRLFANSRTDGWMHRGTLTARDGNESAVVETVSRFSHRSLSLSLSLFLFSSFNLFYVYPFLTLLSWRPFPRFTLRFRNFPVPRGPNFTIDLPSRRRTLCVYRGNSANVRIEKRNTSAFHRGQERFPSRIIALLAFTRALPSMHFYVSFSLFFFSNRVEFLATLRNAISFSLSHRHNLVEVLARFLFRSRECRHSLIYYAHTYTTVLFYLKEFITYSARNASLCFRNAPA